MPRPVFLSRPSDIRRAPDPVLRLVRTTTGDRAMTCDDTLSSLFMANRAKIVRYLSLQGAGEDAEDLLQELWFRVESAAPVEVSVSYLMRMAHNLVIDQARSARQRRRREEAWQVEGPGTGIDRDDAPDAERSLLSRERLQQVEQVLRSLGPRTEAILRRYRLDGVPQQSLATEFGISLSAVEKQLQKAYKAIARAQVEQEPSAGDMA